MAMNIPPWLAIAGITFLVSFIGTLLSPQELRWFKQLNRPEWLTFELLWSPIGTYVTWRMMDLNPSEI